MNYVAMTRTNYFRTKDEQALRDLLGKTYGSEEHITIFELEKNQTKYFGFGCYGSFVGYYDDEDEDIEFDEAFDAFVTRIQPLIADGDAVMIFESGSEGLRYITGYCTIITSKEYKTISVDDYALEVARSMLNNPEWDTRIDY